MKSWSRKVKEEKAPRPLDARANRVRVRVEWNGMMEYRVSIQQKNERKLLFITSYHTLVCSPVSKLW